MYFGKLWMVGRFDQPGGRFGLARLLPMNRQAGEVSVKLGAAGRDGAPPLCRQTDLEPAGSCTSGTAQPLPKYNSFAQLSWGLTEGEDEDIP